MAWALSFFFFVFFSPPLLHCGRGGHRRQQAHHFAEAVVDNLKRSMSMKTSFPFFFLFMLVEEKGPGWAGRSS